MRHPRGEQLQDHFDRTPETTDEGLATADPRIGSDSLQPRHGFRPSLVDCGSSEQVIHRTLCGVDGGADGVTEDDGHLEGCGDITARSAVRILPPTTRAPTHTPALVLVEAKTSGQRAGANVPGATRPV